MKNIEQQIKKELEARKIAPTSMAWERIENELQTPKSEKKTPIWYYIAACVCLLGLIGLYFTNTHAEPQNLENIAIENTANKVSPNSTLTQKEIAVQKEEKRSMEKPVAPPKKELNKTLSIAQNSENHNIDKLNQNPVTTEKDSAEEIIIQEPHSEEILLAESIDQLPTEEVNTTESEKKEGLKINREKLLFYIENEKEIQKPKRIAFENSTLSYDLNKE